MQNRPMSSLPSELWLTIFRLASDIPGILDTSVLPSLQDCPRSWLKVNEATRKTSFMTKLALVRVSRLWNQISLPLLYEHVFIRNADELAAWVARLPNCNDGGYYASTEVTSPHLSWYTKRLEIAYFDVHSEELIRDMTTILSSCPNLIVLHVGENAVFSTPVLPSLQKACDGAKHLRWESRPGTDDLLSILFAFETLEVLEIHDGIFYADWETAEATPIVLPKLHTLVIKDDECRVDVDGLSLWDVPRLARLTLSSIDLGYTENPDGFFETFGQQLTSLDICGSDDPDVPYLLGKCTNLIELSIDSDELYEGFDGPHPTLSRVIVSCGRYITNILDIPSTEFRTLMKAIYAMRGPSLKTIRIVDLGDMLLRGILEKPSHLASVQNLVQEWVDIWAGENVRFEDGSGQLLSEDPAFQPANI
jgi:hypothetical protein